MEGGRPSDEVTGADDEAVTKAMRKRSRVAEGAGSGSAQPSKIWGGLTSSSGEMQAKAGMKWPVKAVGVDGEMTAAAAVSLAEVTDTATVGV